MVENGSQGAANRGLAVDAIGSKQRKQQQRLTGARHIGDTIVCSYGNQLRLVHFPLLSDKKD